MKKILNRLHHKNNLALASKMYLTFLLIFFTSISHHYFFIIFTVLIFYALVNQDFIFKASFWVLVVFAILPGLYTKFLFTGNHSFVTFYLAILFLIASYFSKYSNQILYKNSKMLLAIMMFFAVFQKLLSKTFMDGSSLSFINNTGGFFTHFQRFFPKNQKIINTNNQLISNQIKNTEGLVTSVELEPVNWIFEFNPELTVGFILSVEILFLVLLFVKNQYLRNIFFIFFIMSLVVTRIETGFASLLCILLFLQAQKDNIEFRLIYVVLFAFYTSLSVSGLGYI